MKDRYGAYILTPGNFTTVVNYSTESNRELNTFSMKNAHSFNSVKLFRRRMQNYATLYDKFIQHYATLYNPRRYIAAFSPPYRR